MKPLRIFAVLFGALAASNFLEPLGLSIGSGFVFLGKRLSGAPNLIAAWSFSVFLGCFSIALWREKAVAVPLGIAYAAYLVVNLQYMLLFTYRDAAVPALDVRAFVLCTAIAFIATGGAVAAAVFGRTARNDQGPARILLRSFALLFALMALSNAIKPFAYAADVGFIFFGHRLEGAANTIVALLFSGLLATYAAGIWLEMRYALPLGIAYAGYVILNIVLWNKYSPKEATAPFIYAIAYLVGAIGVSSGAALLLWRQGRRLA
jgi:hypothetical protein